MSASITVKLPDDLKTYVEQSIAAGQHPSVDALITTLLSDERKRQAEKQLLLLVQAGEASGPDEDWTAADWDALEEEVLGTPKQKGRARREPSR